MKKTKKVEAKRKLLMHKECVFSHDPATTLEALIKAALKTTKQVKKRMQQLNADGADKQFINYYLSHDTDHGALFGCEFLFFEAGSDQAIISLQSEAESLPVQAIPAGDDKEFVGGSLYFSVRGNHLVLFQSAALRTVELEQHLNWLIRDKCNLIGGEVQFTLNDHISSKKKNSIRGVKGIKLKTAVADTTFSPKNNKADEEEGDKTRVVKPRGNVLNAIKEFFNESGIIPPELNAKNLAELEDLEMEIFLRWKGRKKKDDQNLFLNNIASQMRHVTDEIDFTVEAESGPITRKQIKLQKHFSVKWGNSGRPEFKDLYGKMAMWLSDLVKDGSVDT